MTARSCKKDRTSASEPLASLLETNFDEFSTCSDAEPVIGGVVRVAVFVAPSGILLVVTSRLTRQCSERI
jgi:hypothetical protein